MPDSRDEIHRLAVTLNGMLDRLEAARARQRAFVADAAHELRSPLTNMRTQLEVAQRLGRPADWPAVADDLLADTRPADPAGRRPAAAGPRRRPPRDGAAPDRPGRAGPACCATVAGALPDGVGVAPSGRSAVDGRRRADALARVVANLLDNAVRHARSSVRAVGRAATAAYCVVTVTDDGPGIPAADRERVFDRFTRLDDARARDAGGAGLGLAIVRELVRRHGGTVYAGRRRPRPAGRGATSRGCPGLGTRAHPRAGGGP